ncbi:GNAT family N-acetyltransferase [Actinoplanes derwentensis]|uniref:GNAT family N-acetyltransferase n=1 Tax=Actinoplanes derwentensis TaxID=113562 RepID=UPI000B82A0AD|nr:GNAT family protein [Actinoplanes derwentensis]GID82425.1 ribosomal protein S5 alanine N-acetyltransferase [Actinoplanes derwentensis]
MSDSIVLRAVTEDDTAVLLDAHLRNREHLAPHEPPRPASFFTLDGQRERVRSLVRQNQDGKLISLLLTRGATVVGYASLSAITPAPLCGANLGYWVDAAEQGRGLAGTAVGALLRTAGERGLHRVEAGTAPANVASQKVLLRNGFAHYGTAHSHLYLNGAWQDSHLYERILSDQPPILAQ